jgi:hypothetical protein
MVERGSPASARPGEAGFTLIEAIIAALLGLFVMVMSLSVLQVQGQLQTRVGESVVRQSVLEFAGSVVTDELRPVTRNGLQYAGPDSVVFRRPLLFGQFCAASGSTSYLYLPLDGQPVPVSQIAGIAFKDDVNDTWTAFDASWSLMSITMSTSAAAACYANGADTTRARSDFGALPFALVPGAVFTLYQIRRISIGTSALDSPNLGLFVGGTGETTREMAAGLKTGTTFSYRHRDGRYLTTPSAGDLSAIEAIRFTAVSSATSRPGAPNESWTVDILLGNAS